MNLKTLSYISAWLQITICIIIIIYFAIQLATHDLEANDDGLDPILLIFLIIIVLSIPFLLALVVGINKNRMILVGIFLYATHTLLVVCVIYMIYEFIMGFAHHKEVADIFIHLLIESAVVGVEFVLTAPIHILYKRRNSPSPDNPPQSSVKKQSGLNSNQTQSVRKISYIA